MHRPLCCCLMLTETFIFRCRVFQPQQMYATLKTWFQYLELLQFIFTVTCSYAKWKIVYFLDVELLALLFKKFQGSVKFDLSAKVSALYQVYLACWLASKKLSMIKYIAVDWQTLWVGIKFRCCMLNLK